MTASDSAPKRGRRGDGERGQSLVELSLVVPLLCVILFAIIEFGLILSDQVTLNHAAQDGARISARGDSSPNQTAAQTQALADLGDLKNCPSPSASAPAGDGGIPDYVTVSVQCTYSPITPLGSLLSMIGQSLDLTPTLKAQTTMRVQ